MCAVASGVKNCIPGAGFPAGIAYSDRMLGPSSTVAGARGTAALPSHRKLCLVHAVAIVEMLAASLNPAGQVNPYGPPAAGWQILKFNMFPGTAPASVPVVFSPRVIAHDVTVLLPTVNVGVAECGTAVYAAALPPPPLAHPAVVAPPFTSVQRL